MFNLIKADLYKETRKRSFIIVCALLIFVSILYVSLVHKNVSNINIINNVYPIMEKSEYLSVNKHGSYEHYYKEYSKYVNKININNKLNIYNKDLSKTIIERCSPILYLIGVIIIFISFHNISYDYTNKTIRYIFQSKYGRSKIIISKVVSLSLISLFLFIIVFITLFITTSLLTRTNLFSLKNVIYFNNEFISIPYFIYYFRYFMFFIPILFMISFSLFLGILFKGSNIGLVISNILYLFSITIYNIGISYNIKILDYTFIPYLDMSYYLDYNQYYLNNIIFNTHTNIFRGFIILIIYFTIINILSLIFIKRDIN